MRPLLPFVLFGLSFTANAQDPFVPMLDTGHGHFGPRRYELLSDSVDYARFRASLRVEDVTGSDPIPWSSYRMLWRESQHGGLWSVTRGDNSVLTARDATPGIGDYEWTQRFRTVEGKRGIILVHDRPCAMICRSVRYYLEE